MGKVFLTSGVLERKISLTETQGLRKDWLKNIFIVCGRRKGGGKLRTPHVEHDV